MEDRRSDRRVRKTKQLLRQSLAALLGEKPLSEITVKELTDRADVNRGTFYCHYRDIYDLKDQVERELFEELMAVIDTYTTDTLRQGLRPILADVFRFLKRNGDFVLVMLRPDSQSGSRTGNVFLDRIRAEIFRRGLQEWQDLYGFQDSAQWEYYLDFVVAGCVALLQSWAKNGMRETPEEMAALSEQLILRGIRQQPPALGGRHRRR